jgi:cell division protein FtsL
VQAVRTSAPAGARRSADAWLASAGLFVLALALLVVGLLYLRQASAIATGGYDVLRLEAERTRWEIANRQLTFQVSELSSLARVETQARERLQMAAPKDVVFLKAR